MPTATSLPCYDMRNREWPVALSPPHMAHSQRPVRRFDCLCDASGCDPVRGQLRQPGATGFHLIPGSSLIHNLFMDRLKSIHHFPLVFGILMLSIKTTPPLSFLNPAAVRRSLGGLLRFLGQKMKKVYFPYCILLLSVVIYSRLV